MKRTPSPGLHNNSRHVDARNFSASWAAYHLLEGEYSSFGGTTDRDMCRTISKHLLAKSGEGERLISRYLMLLDLLQILNLKQTLQ